MQILVPNKTGKCEEYFEKKIFEKSSEKCHFTSISNRKKIRAPPCTYPVSKETKVHQIFL